MGSEGSGRHNAPVLILSIHRSAWKTNSRKSGCRILHSLRSYGTRNTPQRAAAARVLPVSGAVTSVTTVTNLGKGSWTYGGDTHVCVFCA